MGLFFDDEVGDDAADPDDPVEAEDMHAGSQVFAQTRGTSFAEAALPGHSTFEVVGMPMHYSPQFGPDASSAAAAPAYAAFQTFAMGGPHGSDSGAPPSGSVPLPGFGRPQMPPSNASALQSASGGVYAPLSASRSFALAASASLCLSALASVYNVQDLRVWKHIYKLIASTRWL